VIAMMDGPGRFPERASARYLAWVERLYALAKSGMTLGLDPIARVLARLDHPEAAFPAVHVAGSNGKGSTSAFCAAILAESVAGEIGLYTSPHLVSLTERVQFVSRRGFREIEEEAFADAFDAVDRVAPGFEGLSFFEAVTAAGIVAIAEEDVAAAVIEAGLGARLDATLLVDAHVAVLTDLALEHTEVLGDTIDKIAGEKSAVARRGRPFVSAGGPPEAMTVIEEAARRAGAPLYVLGREIDVEPREDGTFDLHLHDRTLARVQLALSGAHQGRNALLAAEAALLFAPKLSDDALRSGLQSAVWPGRMEVLSIPGGPRILLDGAHNAHGTDALVRALCASPESIPRPLHFVFGVLQDKDARRMIEAIAPVAASITLTRPASPRARAPEDSLAWVPVAQRASVEIVPEDLEALAAAIDRARASRGSVVVCGSLYLVGAARARLTTR
jgi:dihydrofolate synthase / folylpolyglutamate synthase